MRKATKADGSITEGISRGSWITMVIIGICYGDFSKEDDGDDKAIKMMQIIWLFSVAYTIKACK